MARIRKSQQQADAALRVQWQTAIYIRLSRDDGNDESYSVKNQRQRLTAYFDAIAAEESMQLAGYYIEANFLLRIIFGIAA